eukprot:m51a1_g12114 hypothetical protein (152) ;mRNA; f:9-570
MLAPRRRFVVVAVPVPAASPAAAATTATATAEPAKETDERRIAQRSKQIEYGHNTEGWRRFTELVPQDQRLRTDPIEPRTDLKCSKRSWDGQVRRWRRLLHFFDNKDASLEQIRASMAEAERKRREAKALKQSSGSSDDDNDDDDDGADNE